MLDIAVQNMGWPDDVDWDTLATRAVDAAVRASPHAALASDAVVIEVAVRLTDDDEVQQLNRQYRHKDQPTNVLSFPQVQADLLPMLVNSDDGEVLLGDIVLARETCAREATDKRISMADHATHLIIHGSLHVLGYDHGEEHEALVMEDLERAAMASLGLADPYALDGDLD